MKTFILKDQEIKREWHLIDATGKTLGRLSTDIALHLSGKKKVFFSPHQDLGDYVVLVNVNDMKLTGKKSKDKKYHHYSGYPGGLSTASYDEKFTKDPEWIIKKTVRGMLPANKLRSIRLNRLKVYLDDKHPYNDKLKEN